MEGAVLTLPKELEGNHGGLLGSVLSAYLVGGGGGTACRVETMGTEAASREGSLGKGASRHSWGQNLIPCGKTLA